MKSYETPVSESENNGMKSFSGSFYIKTEDLKKKKVNKLFKESLLLKN